MPKTNIAQLIKPSGLNSQFLDKPGTFDNYIKRMRDIIIRSRPDLTEKNIGQVVIANSPFSWSSLVKQKKNGVLLIHGLFDSPYYLRDLGQYFFNKNFQVRSILLPGHGTVPGDLLHIHYYEWLKAIRYGIESLAEEVDDIFLVGYSLGGSLALDAILNDISSQIRGLLLIAPAIKTKSKLKNFIAKHYRIFSWMYPQSKWYQLATNNNFTKYSCYPFNAAHQTCLLLDQVNRKLRYKNIEVPVFIATSSDDETICNKAIVNFFSEHSHPKSKMIIYTNEPTHHRDNRIVVRPSQYPELRIINFSHTCIPIAYNNVILGGQSQFYDLQHYADISDINLALLHSGAITRNNLKIHQLARLSYNPDFKNLLANIDQFIENLD